MFFISSPLEQFQILPIIGINLGIFDFSITNASIILAIGLFSFIFVLYSLLSAQGNFYVAPNRIQYIVEVIYNVVSLRFQEQQSKFLMHAYKRQHQILFFHHHRI